MAEARAALANKPVWVDLASSDPAASRDFYARLFGWRVEVNPDPQYGGYALARIGDKDVAGIGPKMAAEAPTAWSLYIGSSDAQELAGQVQAAGGNVIAPPFDVGDQGRMAVFQDTAGAFISVWEPKAMTGFATGQNGTFGWGELHARGIDRAIPFYNRVFGWTAKTSEMGEGSPPYTEFQLDGQSIAGGMEMSPTMPAEVPSYWLVYFAVGDVDSTCQQAVAAGAREVAPPQDFPGGRFAVLTDPQGAAFGLLRMATP
jgi:uncharacterized protein